MKRDEYADDGAFMTAFRAGKEKAFLSVYNTFYTSLCLYAYRLLADEAMARDIAQEAFIKLWENRGNFTAWPAIRSFLYTVVKHASLNHMKHLKIKDNKLKELENEKMEESAIEGMIREEAQRQLTEMIALLPTECRHVMLLLAEGKSYKEAGELLHISPHTVKNHRIHALKILKEKFRRFYMFLFF